MTGLTIGYGDFTPKTAAERLLALTIGLAGIALTGLIAGLTVKALDAAAPTAPPKTKKPRLSLRQPRLSKWWARQG